MTLTLQELLTPPTVDEVIARVLADLADMGFASTSWQEGQPELALVRAFAEIDADRMTAVSTLVRYCFLGRLVDGEEAIAAEIGESWYGVPIHPATQSERSVTLRNDLGAGPWTFAAGAFALSGGGQVFRNVSGFTLAATVGATSIVAMRAEVFGTAGNVANLSDFVTPIAGAVIASQTLSSAARDGETVTAYRERCYAKWGTLATNGELPPRGYEYLIRTDNPYITRTKVDNTNPDGAGTFRAYLARADGVATAGDATDANAVIIDNLPPCASGSAHVATSTALAISAVVEWDPGTNTTTNQNAVEAAATAYVNGLGIGAALRYSELLAAMTAVPGTASVALTSPAADVVIAPFAIHLRSGGVIQHV